MGVSLFVHTGEPCGGRLETFLATGSAARSNICNEIRIPARRFRHADRQRWASRHAVGSSTCRLATTRSPAVNDMNQFAQCRQYTWQLSWPPVPMIETSAPPARFHSVFRQCSERASDLNEVGNSCPISKPIDRRGSNSAQKVSSEFARSCSELFHVVCCAQWALFGGQAAWPRKTDPPMKYSTLQPEHPLDKHPTWTKTTHEKPCPGRTRRLPPGRTRFPTSATMLSWECTRS